VATVIVHPLSLSSLRLMMSNKSVFWLRCEKKEFERRSALTPTTAKKLIDAGFEIFVEKDEQRIFDDSEFEAYVTGTRVAI
jgi:NAD/NADP transhydrogenase alpha subunit